MVTMNLSVSYQVSVQSLIVRSDTNIRLVHHFESLTVHLTGIFKRSEDEVELGPEGCCL